MAAVTNDVKTEAETKEVTRRIHCTDDAARAASKALDSCYPTETRKRAAADAVEANISRLHVAMARSDLVKRIPRVAAPPPRNGLSLNGAIGAAIKHMDNQDVVFVGINGHKGQMLSHLSKMVSESSFKPTEEEKKRLTDPTMLSQMERHRLNVDAIAKHCKSQDDRIKWQDDRINRLQTQVVAQAAAQMAAPQTSWEATRIPTRSSGKRPLAAKAAEADEAFAKMQKFCHALGVSQEDTDEETIKSIRDCMQLIKTSGGADVCARTIKSMAEIQKSNYKMALLTSNLEPNDLVMIQTTFNSILDQDKAVQCTFYQFAVVSDKHLLGYPTTPSVKTVYINDGSVRTNHSPTMIVGSEPEMIKRCYNTNVLESNLNTVFKDSNMDLLHKFASYRNWTSLTILNFKRRMWYFTRAAILKKFPEKLNFVNRYETVNDLSN